MASMTAALRDRLQADAGVKALAGDRSYRDEREQGSPLPACVLQLISDPRQYDYSGRTEYRRSRVMVECLAFSRGAADELADAVIAAAEGPAQIGTTTFERATVANVYGDSARNSEGTIFRTAVDLFVWHHTPDGAPAPLAAPNLTKGD